MMCSKEGRTIHTKRFQKETVEEIEWTLAIIYTSL